jgi:hypothetical protein
MTDPDPVKKLLIDGIKHLNKTIDNRIKVLDVLGKHITGKVGPLARVHASLRRELGHLKLAKQEREKALKTLEETTRKLP